MHELFDAATMAEMRRISDDNLPHTATVLHLTEAFGAGASMRPGVWAPTPTVYRCRLAPYRPTEQVERTRPAHRGTYTVALESTALIDPKQRLRVTGETDGVPWSIDLDVDGVKAPGSYEMFRRLHCTDVGYTLRITSPVEASVTPLAIASTLQFETEVTDHAGALVGGLAALWTTSDTDVATVSPEGLVSGIAAGSVRIVASLGLVSEYRDIVVQ